MSEILHLFAQTTEIHLEKHETTIWEWFGGIAYLTIGFFVYRLHQSSIKQNPKYKTDYQSDARYLLIGIWPILLFAWAVRPKPVAKKSTSETKNEDRIVSKEDHDFS